MDEEDNSDHILALSVVREMLITVLVLSIVAHILVPVFQTDPPFLAGLDQGTPLAEVPGLAALRA